MRNDVDDEGKKGKEESNSEKANLLEGSNTDPINIADDVVSKVVGKKNKEVKTMFKNISISIVGRSSKTIDI